MTKSPAPKFDIAAIMEHLDAATEALELAAALARRLDWVGDAESHPNGSHERKLGAIRDRIDWALGTHLGEIQAIARIRAESSRSSDLLYPVALAKLGDGEDALHLIRRIHKVFADEGDPSIDPGPESLPDFFAWDVYLRVSALADLAKEFPLHVQHSARLMHGWPMIVSHQVDHTIEFRATAERLQLGAEYPLDVGPRKKRGSQTPLLHYLEPKVYRLHVLWEKLPREAAETEVCDPRKLRNWTRIPSDNETFAEGLYGCWWEFPDKKPTAETLAILRRLSGLPQLTQKTAQEWSRRVIVPLIMLEDAGTRGTCKVPALCNIWQHRSVKSRATFQSRLHSAITDTLRRFGRPAVG
jgi:hypothetical protein